MGSVTDKINELIELKRKAKELGGEKNVAKHKEKGKLTARERLDALFDSGTFREVDMFVKHRCVNFGMEDIDIPSDGVVTGYGYVEGRPVFAYAQDFTSRAGSLGEMHAKKICKIMDMVRFFTGTHYARVSFLKYPPSWVPQPGGPYIHLQ